MTRVYVRKPAADRFWAKVHQRPDGCWLWLGAIADTGYGIFQAGTGGSQSRLVGAHRYSYELVHGSVPAGLWVLHRCDNRGCVRPDHLYAGTPADNVHDMDARGRRVNAPCYGSDNINTKLTAEQVEEARRLWVPQKPGRGSKPNSLTALAARYGVAVSTIYAAIKGTKSWRSGTQ